MGCFSLLALAGFSFSTQLLNARGTLDLALVSLLSCMSTSHLLSSLQLQCLSHRQRRTFNFRSLLVLSILIKPPSALSVKLFCGLLFLHQPTSLSYFFPVQTRFPAACYVPVLATRREGLRLLNSSSSPGLGKRVIWMSSCYSDPQQPEWDKGLVL